MLAKRYIVVDLEATCDEGNKVQRHQMEIIEIGAVLVDGDTLEPIDELGTFVRPVACPILSEFCTKLTSIRQRDVDGAPSFAEAAAKLAALGEGALFCSWGNYDRLQLEQDARRNHVAMPLPGAHWNLKPAFSKRANTRRDMGAARAVAHLGLSFEGTLHRGIDDARNIARLLPYILGHELDPKAGTPWAKAKAKKSVATR